MDAPSQNASDSAAPIRQFVDKAREKYSSLTNLQRMLAWGAIAVLAAATAYLTLNPGSHEKVYLYGAHKFSANELTDVENAFSDAGLGDYEIVGYRVLVPQQSKAEYVAALSKAEIAMEGPDSRTQNALDSMSILAPRDQRERQAKLARQQDLSYLVRQIRDIENASVQLDESKVGFPPVVEKTALVAVKTNGGRELPQQRVRAIREAIAAAVAGLTTEHITITNMETGRSWTGLADEDFDASYAIRKTEYENYWRDKILRLLGAVPGVHVEVNVAMEPQGDPSTNNVSAAALAWAPSRVTAAIDVPQSYFRKVWEKQNQNGDPKKTPSPQTLDSIEKATHAKIEELVGRLLQTPGQDSNATNVIVATWTDLPNQPTVEPSPIESIRNWASQNTALVIGIGLVLLGVIFVRVLLASTKAKSPQPSTAVTQSPANQAEQTTPSASLQSQLAALVAENPDAAAEKLNKWFRDAA